MSTAIATKPILDVRDLTKSFVLHNIDGRTVTGLHNVSFVVEPCLLYTSDAADE